LNKLPAEGGSPWDATAFLHNGDVKIRHWKTDRAMDHLVRNQDGDELLFVHDGAGELFCDWGRLDYRDGDYIVVPRGAMWRVAPSAPTTMLLVECTEGTYTLPEKGIVGPHAIFDPAVLDTPAMDAGFRAQQTEDPWNVVVKRNGALSTIGFPFNPLDAVGWHGDLCVVRVNVRDIRPLMSHRYHLPPSAHTTFVGRNFIVCTFVPRPIESDPGALKVPFYHNNDDYDE
jgi:homogentisate 1,2-dioxygenase